MIDQVSAGSCHHQVEGNRQSLAGFTGLRLPRGVRQAVFSANRDRKGPGLALPGRGAYHETLLPRLKLGMFCFLLESFAGGLYCRLPWPFVYVLFR